MKKRILVTGAAGFLGRSLWEFLQKEYPCDEIFGVDLKTGIHPKFFVCQMNRSDDVSRILSEIRPQMIFHLAGGRFSTFQENHDVNIVPTRVLLESIKNIPRYAPRVILPGTAAEYGRAKFSRGGIKETFPQEPLVDYGLVKAMQTQLGLMHARQGMDVVIARMFNVMGAGTPRTLVAGALAAKVVEIERGKGKKELVARNFKGLRDFLDIEDVCRALLAVARNGQRGEVYNICSGKGCTIADLVRHLIKLSTVKRIAAREQKGIPMESFDTVGSFQKLHRASGWKPKVSWRESLQKTLDFYRGLP